MNEFEIIARYFRPLTTGAAGTFDLQDDAAFLSSADMPDGLVVTTDCLVAGRHFFASDRAEDIAIKAIGVNLSDLAAKGAKPFRYQLALALPKDISSDWLAAFAAGLQRVQQETGCLLSGGDTVGTAGPLTICVTMMGLPCHHEMVRRAGANAGDVVLVSGTIGDAAIGLALRTGAFSKELFGLSEEEKGWFARRYLYPEPRTELAPLVARYATAAMDISDGLVGDLEKLCVASGVRVMLDPDAVPVASPLQNLADMDARIFTLLVTGGDDYEILFTASPTDVPSLVQHAQTTGIPLTRIGVVEEKAKEMITFPSASQRKIISGSGSFDHFA